MMRFVLLFPLLWIPVLAQETSQPAAAPPPQVTKSSDSQAAPPNLPSNPAVITIKGICNSATSSAKAPATKVATHKSVNPECKIVVTRSEFERLAETLQVPPAARKQFATQYATALIMANEAHKRGLDHGTHYEELLKLARLQVLTRQLAQNLQEESAKIPDQELQNYYHNNNPAYEEASLERLYVPRTQQQDAPKETPNEADTKKRQEDSEATMKKEADDLRARAAAGEDFAKLQVEAYKFASFKASPPEVKIEKARRTTLPPSQVSVLDMKPGEVSQLFVDPGGYFIYKLEQKDTIPFDRVRDEIRAALQKKRMQDATQTMQQSATPSFDDAYFASTSPASPAHAPGMSPGNHTPSNTPSTGPK
jgi:bifunctional DNA-binding transcriptional regulator/antitoxin component of YhaV-PrlF toxin-antitoxin module